MKSVPLFSTTAAADDDHHNDEEEEDNNGDNDDDECDVGAVAVVLLDGGAGHHTPFLHSAHLAHGQLVFTLHTLGEKKLQCFPFNSLKKAVL